MQLIIYILYSLIIYVIIITKSMLRKIKDFQVAYYK